MQRPTSPRGMRDFLPMEKSKRQKVLSVIREVYSSHGFGEIEAPSMESIKWLQSNQGGDNEKLVFKVLKRGLTNEALSAAESSDDLVDLGLRYDLTLPLARFYATNQAQLPKVTKVLQTGSVWRAERPQKWRYREFVQSDVDIIGDSSPASDVEVVVVGLRALQALGLGDITLKINDRRILLAAMDKFAIGDSLQPEVLIVVDKYDKIGIEGVRAELQVLLGEKSEALVDWIESSSSGASLEQSCTELGLVLSDFVYIFDQIRSIATDMKINVVYEPTLVRGQSYYTGAIFEVVHDSHNKSIAGGGRYDNMIGMFLGQSVPAVGFSLGFEAICDLVPDSILDTSGRVALIHDEGIDAKSLDGARLQMISQGKSVRLVKRQKNMAPLLDSLKAEGYQFWASIDSSGSISDPKVIN